MDDDPTMWPIACCEAFSPAMLGVAFLAGSFVGLRHRRRAALVFLGATPIVSPILAYPSVGYLVWQGGGGVFEMPLLRDAIELAVVFYLPFIALYFAIGRSRLFLLVPGVLSVVAVLLFISSRWTLALLPRLLVSSAPFFPGFLSAHRGKHRVWLFT